MKGHVPFAAVDEDASFHSKLEPSRRLTQFRHSDLFNDAELEPSRRLTQFRCLDLFNDTELEP